MSEQTDTDRSKLDAKWQRRFQVFDEAGGTMDVQKSPTYKGMEFLERTTVTFNIWAFFFGILYFLYLGIFKRGVGIGAVAFFLYLVLLGLDMSDGWFRALSVGVQATYAALANYYYYIRVTQGRDEWDPLRDIRRV